MRNAVGARMTLTNPGTWRRLLGVRSRELLEDSSLGHCATDLNIKLVFNRLNERASFKKCGDSCYDCATRFVGSR